MKKVNSLRPSKKSKRSSRPISRSRRLAQTHVGLVFVRKFQDALARHQLLPRGSKIVVGVSGGPDSMALLTLLARLQKKHHFLLHVAHVNYELRGRDSHQDERLVESACEEYAIPCSVLYPKIKPKSNIEATLRDIRYSFFETLRRELRYDTIVTAHTMNDLAETFLLNLIRGAGMVGLSPFQRPHSRLARPLIHFTRAEIEAFLQSEHIVARVDKTNLSLQFTRNRIRQKLLPLLSEFNPNIVATLARTAEHLAQPGPKRRPTT